MVSQRIRKACIGLCLSLLLLSTFPVLLSDEKTELYLLEQALSVCYTTEEKDAVVRVFLSHCPSLKDEKTSRGITVGSISLIRFVECGTPDIVTLMEVISRLDKKTSEEIFKHLTQPPRLDKKIETTHFVIYYTETGFNATTERFAKQIAKIMEEKIFATEIGEWGYKKPSSGSQSSDGRYRVDIRELFTCNASIRPTFKWDGTTMAVDTGLEGEKESRIVSTCGHEYYHAIQSAYFKVKDVYTPDYETHPEVRPWVMEGSAEWMEHEIFRKYYKEEGVDHYNSKTFVEYWNNYLKHPHEGFDFKDYEAVAYWFFLANNSRVNFSGSDNQRNVIRKFWEAMQADYESITKEEEKRKVWFNIYTNLTTALSGAGSEYNNFDKSFKAFIQSNYFKDVSDSDPWYKDDGQFRKDMSKVQRVKTKQVKLSSGSHKETFKLLGSCSSHYLEIYNDTELKNN